MNDSIAILHDIFREQRKQEEVLMFRNPSFSFWYNWLIAVTVLALFVSFAIWGIDIKTQKTAEKMTATVLASWQSEQVVQDESAVSSQEYVINAEAEAMAKAFYGIDRFVEKYHYTEDDLITYARCIFNRTDRTDSKDLIRVISEPNQFTGYSDGNQVIADYKQLAQRLITEWHEETVKPCDSAFIFAELTPDGIFLKKDLHADGYARRWHA